jgi:hypothetical protein
MKKENTWVTYEASSRPNACSAALEQAREQNINKKILFSE